MPITPPFLSIAVFDILLSVSTESRTKKNDEFNESIERNLFNTSKKIWGKFLGPMKFLNEAGRFGKKRRKGWKIRRNPDCNRSGGWRGAFSAFEAQITAALDGVEYSEKCLSLWRALATVEPSENSLSEVYHRHIHGLSAKPSHCNREARVWLIPW